MRSCRLDAVAFAALLTVVLGGCGDRTSPPLGASGAGGSDWDGGDASTEDSPEEESAVPDGPIDEAACKRIVGQPGCATRCGCANCPVESVACYLDPDCRAIVQCAADHGCMTAFCPPCDGVFALHPAGVGAAFTVGTCYAASCGSACLCPGCDVSTDGGSDAPAMSDADAASREEFDGTADGLESGGSSEADGEG